MKLCYKVVCLIFALFVRSGAQQNGDIKLEGNPTSLTTGRLEVFKNGTWTNMCYDYLVPKTQRGVAQAACRQLGYNDYAHVGNVTTFGLPGGSGGADKLSNGDCLYYNDTTNAPQHIFKCAFLGGKCSHGDDMAIECEGSPRNSNPFDTMVNLVQDSTNLPSSASNSSGFAQIYLNEQWGPVCNMQKTEADTFCRQLSYTNAVSVENMNSRLTTHPLLDKFQCKTNHSGCLHNCFDYPKVNQTIDCPNSDYSYVTCTYVEDTPGTKSTGDITDTIMPSTSTLVAVGVTLGAAVIAPLALPVIIWGAGFTATGVAAGSVAAAGQAIIGNVAAGSAFAALQSAGVLGVAGTTSAAVSGAAAAVTGATTGALAWLRG